MKYIAFIIGIIVVFLAGSFVWNIVSDSLSGADFSIKVNGPDIKDSDSDNEDVGNLDSGNAGTDEEVSADDSEGVVSISSIRRNSSSRSPQSITLRSNLGNNETVNITGWRIKTNDGTAVIPEAVNFYDMSGSNDESDIILNEDDKVTIYFDELPLPDNLRLNKCTGYLNQKYDLNNFLPEDCPAVDQSLYKHLAGFCQEYISRINGDCEVPDSETLNTFPSSKEGNECREFVFEHFNSGYCMDTYEDDEDFLSDDWRLWIDKRDVLDTEHDWVRLYNNNVLIDERNY